MIFCGNILMSTLLTMVIQLYFSNLVYVVYVCTCTWVHIHMYICRFVHTCMVWCTLGCPSTYNTCIHVKTPPPHPTPHSLHLPLTLPKLPFSLHTQYPVHLTTSYHLHQHRHLSIRPHLSLTSIHLNHRSTPLYPTMATPMLC